MPAISSAVMASRAPSASLLSSAMDMAFRHARHEQHFQYAINDGGKTLADAGMNKLVQTSKMGRNERKNRSV